jgi:hypothetical protein
MTGWPCWNCGAPSWDEAAPTPEVWCCDLTFAEREQSAKKRLDQGDQGELLRFINWCFVQRREVPAWARQKFDDAVNRVRGFEVKSWDDVFGRPLRKGQQLAANRRKGVETAARVWKCANARRRAGEPVDKATFAAIGGTSVSVAPRLCRKFTAQSCGSFGRATKPKSMAVAPRGRCTERP